MTEWEKIIREALKPAKPEWEKVLEQDPEDWERREKVYRTLSIDEATVEDLVRTLKECKEETGKECYIKVKGRTVYILY